MELKQKLQDYTRAEFVAFIEKINKVDVSKQEHDELILHFDEVVKHPKGADLLLYRDATDNFFDYGLTDQTLYHVKKWHNDQGQLAFKDDSLPQPRQRPGGTPQSSAQERARTASSQNLVKVQKIAGQINDSKRSLESAFANLEALLAEAEPIAQLPASADRTAFALTERRLGNVEAAQAAVTRGMYGYDSLRLTVQFAKDDAQRSISYSHLDGGLQAAILQQINHTSEQYLASRSMFATRQRELHVRTEALLHVLETHLIRSASAINAGPLKDANIFTSYLSDVDSAPRVLTTYSDIAGAFDVVLPDLHKAIRSAVAGLAWEATADAETQSAKRASVMSFQFDRPGCGEPFALSIPLSEIAPTEGRDWQYLASAGSQVDLTFRMASGVTGIPHGKLFQGLKEISELANICVVATNSPGVASKVDVCAAVLSADSTTYHLSRSGYPLNTVQWRRHSLASGIDASDSSRKRSSPPGFIIPVGAPVVDVVPVIDDLNFDDCIVVFPPESGIEPIYLMFKGAREFAGVASGVGQLVGDSWLQDGAAGLNAPLPSPIADQLRGKVFKRFSLFRDAFWKALTNYPQLAKQLTAENLAEMRAGRGPFISTTSALQQSERLEIRYVLTPANGGGIYDMDNMRIAARQGR